MCSYPTNNDHLEADTLALRPDESLIDLARSGVDLAFAELCNRHRATAFRIAFRITRSREDAEDVVQESLVRAFTHLQTFDGRSTFSTWLMRIVINSALMNLRRRRRRPDIALDDISEPFPNSHGSSSPELSLLDREGQELVKAAIRQLPSALRGVTEIRYAHDVSLNEISEMVGLSVAATKSRLLRARKILRRTLCAMEID